MWRKIFTLSMLLSANLVVQIEAIKFKVSGKLVFPEDGVYTHIPANSCLVVKVVEHILCDGQCDALRLSGKSIIHNVTFSSNIFEYELTCEHLMLPYILSSRLHIGWCPSPDYKGPYIEKGDYENEFGYRFQMRGYEIEYNASDMKMVPYDSLGLCGTKQCDLKSESCQVNENGKAYCRCNVQGGCKTGGGKSIDGKVGDKNYILIYAINGGCFLFFILLLVCVVCVCKGRKRANSENARRSNNTSAMGSLRKDRIMIDLAANEYDKRQKAKENVYVDLPAYLTEAPPSYTVYEDEKPPIYDEIAAYKARVGIE